MQFTINGKACVNEGCVQSTKSYYYCKTNANALGGRGRDKWWDYCSLSGFTTNHVPCTHECDKYGEDYYWCHTGTESGTTVHHLAELSQLRRLSMVDCVYLSVACLVR